VGCQGIGADRRGGCHRWEPCHVPAQITVAESATLGRARSVAGKARGKKPRSSGARERGHSVHRLELCITPSRWFSAGSRIQTSFRRLAV
jgi:hypothetical protein